MHYARFTLAITGAAGLLAAGAFAAVVGKEDFTLEPAVETAWQQALEAARPLRVERDEKRLAEQVTALKEAQALDAEAVKQLEAAIPAVVQEAVGHWEAFICHVRRPLLRGPEEKGLKALNSLEKNPADYLSRYVVPYYHRPEQLEGWTLAVKGVLSAEAWRVWEAERKEQNQQRHDQARELVAAGMKKLKPAESYERSYEGLWRELEVVLVEPEPVLKGLKAEVEGWAVAYAERCESESVLRMDSFTQGQGSWNDAVKRGYYLYWAHRVDDEGRKEALLGRLEVGVREKHAALVAGWGERERQALRRAQALVVELAVPLTDGQRAEVERAAEQLPQREMVGQNSGDWQVWKDWQGEALKQLNGILGDSQERLWVQRVKSWESNVYREPELPAAEPVRHPGAGPADPAEVEAAVSEYLAEGSRLDVAKALPTVMRRVEEVVQVVGLDEASRGRLELLAKGTLQLQAQAQRKNASSYVRSQAQNATPATIRQQLMGLGRISFSSRSNEKSMLELAIDEQLTAEQKEQLVAHEAAMQQRLEQCIVGLILARLERQLVLGKEQSAALEKQLGVVMTKYGPDIVRTFQSFGERVPWFLQSYYLLVPCFGVEEGELKKLFNERQMGMWQEQAQRSGSHYWEQVQRFHEARKQSKKEDQEEVIFIE